MVNNSALRTADDDIKGLEVWIASVNILTWKNVMIFVCYQTI